jgi:D-tyrosyl-tRNA(Tyr) deacylase
MAIRMGAYDDPHLCGTRRSRPVRIGKISHAMRAVVQRVAHASVTVDGAVVGAIDAGLLVLLGVAAGDAEEQAARLADKVARLRIFENETGKFDRSVLDTGGAVLAVSQFTLIADSKKGTRPDFSGAAPSEEAEPLYEHFCQALRDLSVHVETGVFGAHMAVELVNDGPVTIILDS